MTGIAEKKLPHDGINHMGQFQLIYCKIIIQGNT